MPEPIRFVVTGLPASGVNVAAVLEPWAPASATLEAALDYQRLGLSVIPMCRPTQGGCSCPWHRHPPKDAGKTPLVRWERYQLKAPDAAQIDKWWTHSPEANVAMVTGEVSSVVVFDADGPIGFQSLKALGAEAVDTWVSRTGRPEGGRHFFYRHPGQRIRSRVGILRGLDVRGDGGYVILPPSLHYTGPQYEWLTSPQEVALAPLPEALLKLLIAPTTGPLGRLAGEVIPEGQRNDFLYRLGRSLGATGSGAEAIHAALIAENRARCRPPLSDHEVRAIAEHVITQPDRPEFRSAAAITPGVAVRRRLSPRMEEVLRDGDTAGRYRRPDAMIEALALAAHNAGWSEAQLFAALMDPMNKAGEMIRRCRIVPGPFAKELIGRDEIGRVTLPISVRSVALSVGCGRSTVSESFHCLEHYGFMALDRRARRATGQPAIWSLRLPRIRCTRLDSSISWGTGAGRCTPPDSSISPPSSWRLYCPGQGGSSHYNCSLSS